jgi:hypothetical protein
MRRIIYVLMLHFWQDIVMLVVQFFSVHSLAYRLHYGPVKVSELNLSPKPLGVI